MLSRQRYVKSTTLITNENNYFNRPIRKFRCLVHKRQGRTSAFLRLLCRCHSAHCLYLAEYCGYNWHLPSLLANGFFRTPCVMCSDGYAIPSPYAVACFCLRHICHYSPTTWNDAHCISSLPDPSRLRSDGYILPSRFLHHLTLPSFGLHTPDSTPSNGFKHRNIAQRNAVRRPRHRPANRATLRITLHFHLCSGCH